MKQRAAFGTLLLARIIHACPGNVRVVLGSAARRRLRPSWSERTAGFAGESCGKLIEGAPILVHFTRRKTPPAENERRAARHSLVLGGSECEPAADRFEKWS